MASQIAKEKETPGQEEITSFASLLRTFLPEHNDLPLMENPDQFLQHVKDSLENNHILKENESIEKISHNNSDLCLTRSERIDKSLVCGLSYDKKNTALDNHSSNNLDRLATENSDSDATIDMPISENIEKSCFKAVIPASFSDLKLKSENSSCLKHYACFICDDTFLDLSVYTAHMISHCTNRTHINCTDCGETFTNLIIYNNHRRLSTYEIWVDRALAVQAMKVDTNDTKDNNFVRSKKRKRGIREEKYVCRACGKFIYKYSSFLKHVRTHDGISAFRCAVCQETFEAPCILRTHIDVQHSHVLPFQCRRCLRRFKLRCSLSTHLKYCQVDHSSLPYAEEIHFIDQLSQQRKFQGVTEDDGLSQYSCPICTVMFDTPEELKQHFNSHDETKPHKCEECGRGFQTKRMLQKHAALHQTRYDCRCEICGVQLLTLSGYNAHLRGHRNQEIIQAQFFPDSSAEASGENSTVEPALEILQRLKSQGDNRSDDKVQGPQDNCEIATKKKTKNYSCPLCGIRFFSGGAKFQIHARKEHKDAAFDKCSLCNKTFLGKENLERHLKLHKMFAETFPCDECGKKFRRKYALQVHKKMHTFKKFVKCDICGQEFRFVSEVDKHKNKKHRYDRMLNIYKCNICGQRFPMLSHLSVHCYCHNLPNSKPFECDLCKVSFSTSIELKQHIYQKHDKLMKKLGESTYVPATGTFLSLVNPFRSNFDVPAVKQEVLDDEDSERMKDGNVESNMATATSAAKLKSFNTPTSAEAMKCNETAKSDVCGKEATEQGDNLPSNVNEYNMISRQFSHHSKILKRYSCEVCQKAFASNSDLKTHRRTHSGETPFKCDYCDRSFKQRGHRKLHIQVVHTKIMPYKCDQCDSAFPTRSRYQIHLKRHIGLREHRCPYCEREFYTLGKLNEHKKKRHPSEMKEEQEQITNAVEKHIEPGSELKDSC